ncbi:MAG: dephospho-CoA kinase [Candidatus Omnitrophica bacterium]|nr:dephospho-CoA kinase [Candidatus Omnitrophota bacterium]
MLIIGITGSIATGKSTVAGYFRDLGAKVFDADKVAHLLMRKGMPAYNEIVRWQGKGILTRPGAINRKALAEMVFNNERALKRLCHILHPGVKEFLIHKSKQIKKKEPGAIVVWDVPLLFEAGMDKETDVTVVVNASRAQQLKRIVKKGNLTKEEFGARMKFQMPIEKKNRMSDYQVDNNGTLRELKDRVRKIWKEEVVKYGSFRDR